MNFRVNKAQISMFVIIATIIVIAFIFFLSLNLNSVPIFKDDTSSYKVKEFVDSCLDLESKKAVELIGEHGGWLYHSNLLFTDRAKPKQFNKRTQGLNFLEKQEIPYWYYFDDSNGVFKTNIPDYDEDTRYSIKNQIKKYVDDNLEKNCLQSFHAFDKVYTINFEPKEINSKVEFIDDKIEVSLVLPLEIIEENTNNTEYISKFKNNIYNELRVPYNLAKDIVTAEANSSFIEKRILQFIVPYQDSNTRDLLPPFYDFKVKYDFKPWNLKKTIPLVEQIISSNIDSIGFYSTDFTPPKVPPGLENNQFARSFVQVHLKDYLSQTSKTKINDPNLFKEYKNYQVKTNYIPKLFPSSISISPSSGDVILLPRPQAVINLIPFFFTEYTAVYQMTLPILFEIKSPNSPNFVFNLAIESNIDYNTPLAENRILNLNKDKFNLDSGKSLICDPPQFISDFVTLNITDPLSGGKRFYDQKKRKFNMGETGVDGAIVNFDCSGLSTCFIGETKEVDNKTQLKFRLPINCNPGTLEIYKYGHKRLTFKNLDPTLNQPINLGEVKMPSKRTLPLKIELQDYDASKYAQGKRIGRNESAFLIFENLEDNEVVEVVEITYQNQDKLNISLLPGNYSLQGFVISNKAFTIPSEEICYNTGVIFSKKKCQTLPKIDLDAWVRASIEIGRFEVPLNTLVSRKEFVVNIIDFGIPNSYSALEDLSSQMGDLKKLSTGFEPYFN